MDLPLFILKTYPPKTAPIANLVITESMLFLPVFFALQVVFVVFWMERHHNLKLILLFSNSMMVVLYSVYAIVAIHLERMITYGVILCGLQFLIVQARRSDKKKEKSRRSSSRQLNQRLVIAWVAVVILAVMIMFSREIRSYL